LAYCSILFEYAYGQRGGIQVCMVSYNIEMRIINQKSEPEKLHTYMHVAVCAMYACHLPFFDPPSLWRWSPWCWGCPWRW